MKLFTAEEREVLLFLLIGAVVENGIGELGRRREGKGQGGVPVAQFLEHNGVGHHGPGLAPASVLGGNLGAGEPQLPSRLEDILGDRRGFVTLPANGAKGISGELAQRVPDQFLFFRQTK